MIFKGKIDAYIKRSAIQDNNVQKAYSLVLGQCTDLLQSKMKQQNTWATIALAQDVIELVKLIKAITFWFEDQKFLPLALYQAKANLYNPLVCPITTTCSDSTILLTSQQHTMVKCMTRPLWPSRRKSYIQELSFQL
jgi:hypothetical protein